MDQVTQTMNWDELNPQQLDAMERKIAAKYIQKFPLGVIIWGFANTTIWLALWPLVIMDILPIWAAFPIAIVNVCAAYLPSHDAQHSIIAREGHKLRWLNELLGHVSLIPFAQAFRYLRYTHFEHHAHTNNPNLDPDFDVHAENRRAYFKNALMRKQPVGRKAKDLYYASLERTDNAHVAVDAIAIRSLYTLVLFVAACSGYAIEAALLWWLPLHIADIYIPYYLSWKPHHPGENQGRYKDTEAFKSTLGNLLSSGMQYHVVHHLYPRIPLMHTPAAFREMRPILRRRGCDLRGM
jgi:beta-carotene hydroxylase